jgi:hypothetical protein
VAYRYLLRLRTMLSTGKAPQSGRFVVAPPWFVGELLNDNKIIATGSFAAEDRLQNGFIGRAAGFDIYESNNLPVEANGTAHRIIAGHPWATSYVQSVLNLVSYRHPKWPADDAVFGLLVFGGKVVRPDMLATLYANDPNENGEE